MRKIEWKKLIALGCICIMLGLTSYSLGYNSACNNCTVVYVPSNTYDSQQIAQNR